MFPHERSLVKRLADKPFVLLGVNNDSNREDAAKRAAEAEVNWRSFWDGPKGAGGPIATKWNVQGWPTLYLIDHEGVIRNKWVGNPGDQVIDAEIEKLVAVAEKSVSATVGGD